MFKKLFYEQKQDSFTEKLLVNRINEQNRLHSCWILFINRAPCSKVPDLFTRPCLSHQKNSHPIHLCRDESFTRDTTLIREDNNLLPASFWITVFHRVHVLLFSMHCSRMDSLIFYTGSHLPPALFR